MSTESEKITEQELLAFADGQLDSTRMAAVEKYLEDHPRANDKINAWRAQNAAISALYGNIIDETVPDRLISRRIAIDLDRRRSSWRKMAAAAVLILGIGISGGWFARGIVDPGMIATSSLVQEAIYAHKLYVPEVLHPVEVRAGESAHLKAWLSKRLDRSVEIPDLRFAGFNLVGGRLLPAGSGPAAQFMYEDKTGHRITLFIIPASDGIETAFRFVRENSIETFYWTDEAKSCALVGDLPREELHRIALKAYEQLS
jgi:anti-sigma factor RsiW